MPPLETRTDSQGRLQKYPKIHVRTGEKYSGFSTDSTQGLRPWHRRQSNPERPPSYLHGDWPFLRPPERVPEGPVVSRGHLPQLEKIQEVLPSRRDDAHFHRGISRVITSNLWNFQRILHTLAASQEVPRHTRLHLRGSRRVPPTCTGHPFPPHRTRGGILSLRGGEIFPAFPSHLKRMRSPQERREELQGRATIPRVSQMSQSIPGKPVFPALPRLSSQGSTHTTGARGTAL